jgi:hypothetical protein
MANRQLEKDIVLVDQREAELDKKEKINLETYLLNEKALRIRETALQQHRKPIHKKIATLNQYLHDQTVMTKNYKDLSKRQGETISELRTSVRDLRYELSTLKEVQVFINMLSEILERKRICQS